MHHAITIVGAGLGGLTLARILSVHGIETAVYDVDASPNARAQGGMLDMHLESGQAALLAAGLHDEFRAAIHTGGQAMRILDKHATVHMEEKDDGTGERPEINRNALRTILLAALPADTIRWGAKVTGARPLDDGRHQVTLANGTTVTTDLLIGADGAWSKIRPLVSDAVPTYGGISFVEMHLNDADVRHPGSAAVVGGGMLFALAEEKGFLAHRDGDGRVHVYCALKTPADWATDGGIDFTDTDATKKRLLACFDGWDEQLLALITDADAPLIARPIHALPIGHRWDRVPGVTLLGDAAHLMSPFAGEGANLAMLDGAELAASLVAHPGDVEKALATYEQAMFPRSHDAAAASADSMAMCFSPDAPNGLLDQFAHHHNG